MTQGQCVLNVFCKVFSGVLYFTIFGVPKYAPQIPYLAHLAVLGAYLAGGLNATIQGEVTSLKSGGKLVTLFGGSFGNMF